MDAKHDTDSLRADLLKLRHAALDAAAEALQEAAAATALPVNGGPAFPGITLNDTERNLVDPFGTLLPPDSQATYSGMTLRDYFAAKAMQASVTTDMVPGEACDALIDAAAAHGQDPVYRLALLSYEIADAMLKARLS